MARLFPRLIFVLYFCLVCPNILPNGNLENVEEIDACLELKQIFYHSDLKI
jgi:hypothetical protein